MRARGGFEADAAWANGALKSATITSRLGGPCRVRWGKFAAELKTAAGETYVLDPKAVGKLRFLPRAGS